MVIRVLGPLDTGESTLSPRERAMFAALIVRAGSTVSPAELADAWWGDKLPPTWSAQVKNSVARIRSRLGSHTVETVGSEYRLGLDPDAIDAVRFERLVSQARAHALHGEHDRAVDAYQRALGLWRGAPLQDVAGWEPGVVEAMRLNEIRSSAEEEALDARLAAGEHRALIPAAERLLREQPLREDRWAIVALANYRAGRQADALAVVRAARERLADELGIEPGARLSSLELAILRHDPELDPPAAAPAIAANCPYPGLRPFGPDDADVFVGRENDIEGVLDRITPGSVVTIAGASGTGKSSLLLAGVLPRLTSRGTTLEVRPDSGGIAEMRRGLERAQVLAIDQAEEMVGAQEEDIAAFAAAARAFLDGGGTMLITVRSDTLDRLRALPSIGDEIGHGVYLLGPLSEEALRRAIEEPAHTSGLVLEPGLTELAVHDAGRRVAALPHLSHAMRETWERREGATLTVAGYRESGGVPGAIAQSAENVFRGLAPGEQELCRSLLMRMLERGVDGVSTRRRVAAAPLLADPSRRRVLERLTQARLVTTDGDAIVVSHESIGTAWPRLDGWLEEDAEGARTPRAVESAAAAWDDGGRDDDDLLRGARLHSALDWRDAVHPDLTDVEKELLDVSAAHEQGELRELTERAGRDRRRNRVLGGALAASALLLVVAIVAGVLAGMRAREAADAAENAKIEAVVATSLSLRANDRGAAALLAAEAFRRWPEDGRVRSALFGTITAAGGLLGTYRTPDAEHTVMTVVPGTTAALRVTDYPDHTALDIVDVATGEVLRTLDVDVPLQERWLSNSRDVAISDDGRVALVQSGIDADPTDAVTCCWNRLDFIDMESGTRMAGSTLLRVRTSTTPDLGEDGSVVYLAHPQTAELLVVDSLTGALRASSPIVHEDYSGRSGLYDAVAVVNHDLVATGDYDHVYLFDRHSLERVGTIPVDGDVASRSIVVVDDSLYTSGNEGIARIDAATGAVLWRHSLTASEACADLEWAIDGALLCLALGHFYTIDPETGLALGGSFDTQADYQQRLWVADDGTVLVDDWVNATWQHWRIDGGSASVAMIGKGRYISDDPSPDGRLIPTGVIDDDTTMQVWDPAADAPVGPAHTGVTVLSNDVIEYYEEGVGFGLQNIHTGKQYPYRIQDLPDDFWLMDGGWGPLGFVAFDGRLVAFDPETGLQIGEALTIEGSSMDGLAGVSESADGERVVVTWNDNAVGHLQAAVLRIADGKTLVKGLPGRHAAILTSQDRIIAVAEERVERVDPETLETTSTLAQATGGSQVLVESLDGRTLLNVGTDKRVRLYDLTRDIPLGDVIDTDAPWAWSGGFLSSDGLTLYTNGQNGILKWDLDLESQARSACEIAGREFTAAEWSTYFPGEPHVATCADVLG